MDYRYAYAGSWILFDSGRIGLNIFPAYRGGESQYIFEQVLEMHMEVYHLNRFSVDPYQIGKENSEGIKFRSILDLLSCRVSPDSGRTEKNLLKQKR